jgi:hypothetical protein
MGDDSGVRNREGSKVGKSSPLLWGNAVLFVPVPCSSAHRGQRVPSLGAYFMDAQSLTPDEWR